MKRRLLRACGSALLLASFHPVLASGAAPTDQDQRAPLTATVNGIDKGDVLVILRGDDVLVGVDALQRLGLHGFDGAREQLGDVTFVSLRSLASDLVFEVDDRALVLQLTVGPQWLETTKRDFGSGRPADLEYRSDRSAFANYSLSLHGRSGYEAFADVGVRAGGAFFGSTVTAAAERPPVRLLSSAIFDQPDRLRRVTVGDMFANTGLLGGGALIGGVTIAREYSVDPYFVRYPTFRMSGAVTTPSTVDVYVGNRLVRTEHIAPGQFELARLPISTGRNDARVVIRDAFGGVREISETYYLTSSALARGLHEYSYSVGAKRWRFGADSWAYGGPVLLARHRVGFTDVLTFGGRLEATSDLASGGLTLNVRLPFGEIEVGGAASRADGVAGAAGAGAFAYVGRPLSAGIAFHGMTSSYSTTSLQPLEDRPRIDLNEYVTFPIGTRVSMTIQRRDQRPYADSPTSRTSVTASTRLNSRSDLFVTSAADRGPMRMGGELFVGISYRIGTRATASLALDRRRGTNHTIGEVQKSLPAGVGWGYRLHAESGDRNWSSAQVEYQGAHGRYQLHQDQAGSARQTTVTMSGALVAMDGGLYASRAIQDGFALVRVPAVPGVRTYASNQEVGRTNKSGNVLVPNLLSYYGNILNISDHDIPFDNTVGSVRKTVAPPYRGGALVVFPVARVRGATGTLELHVDGKVIVPAYGQLTIATPSQKVTSPIGEHGEFYLENMPGGRYGAVVEYRGLSCAFLLDMPQSEQPIVHLGTVRCGLGPR